MTYSDYEQVSTDGKFTISKDMDFQDADGKTIVYKVTISGAVLEPIEPTPVEKDDGMGITATSSSSSSSSQRSLLSSWPSG